MGAPYFGNFTSYEGMLREFARYDYASSTHLPIEGAPSPEQVLFASYGTPAYEGYAAVIFERDGKLYEVGASHCSCRGLEEQWEPAEVTWPALALRDFGPDGWLGSYKEHAPEAREFLKALVESKVGHAVSEGASR